jgi:hypothetical protein
MGTREYARHRQTKFVETRHVVFLEDEMIRGSTVVPKIDLEEKRVCVPNPMIQEPYFSLPVVPAPTVPEIVVQAPIAIPPVSTMSENLEPVLQDSIESTVAHEDEAQQPPVDNVPTDVEAQNVPTEEAPCRSQRVKRSAIPDDYKVYNTEIAHMEDDPASYEEAMRSAHSSKWLEVMEDEMKSMSSNDVWDLVEIPKGAKTVGCKWVYKIKRNSRGNIEKYKARLVEKGHTQIEGIDYNETFSPVSCKDSFIIIMVLVAHFDLE